MSSHHRLAAILFSDIVDYTATMQQDEQEAARQIAVHRRVLEETVPAHEGEILQYYGDGSLCIFQSAIDAVNCALAVQDILTTGDEVPLRIGIHLGEIFFEDGQYIGDGINIAARIQAEAHRGEVLISDSITSIVRNKTHLHLSDLGERSLKNVGAPVHLFRVGKETNAAQAEEAVNTIAKRPRHKGRRRLWLGAAVLVVLLGAFYLQKLWPRSGSDEKSIAIVPFSSLSDNLEDEYFSEGIADEVRSKLAGVKGLDVRSRSSSAVVKDKKMSAKEIAKALDIRYILEGSVQRAGSGLLMNLSLIDAIKDQLVQPIHYEVSNPEDIFSAQNEIAQLVLDLVQVKLLPQDEANISRVETTNFDAHRYYLLANSYLLKSTSREDYLKSIEYFRMAIGKDSMYAKAYAGLAEALVYPAIYGYARLSDVMPKVKEVAFKAMDLNPNIAETQHVMGTIYELECKFDLAQEALQRAVSLDPSMALSYLRLARINVIFGRSAKALDYAEKAAKLDPLSPIIVSTVPTVYTRLGLTDKCIETCLEDLRLFPKDNNLLWLLGQAYTMQGEYDRAIQALLSRSVSTAKYNFVLGYTYAMKGDTAHAYEILNYLLAKNEKAYVPPSMIGIIYLGLGNMQETYAWVSKEENYFFLLFPELKPLWENPDYRDIYAFRKTQG